MTSLEQTTFCTEEILTRLQCRVAALQVRYPDLDMSSMKPLLDVIRKNSTKTDVLTYWGYSLPEQVDSEWAEFLAGISIVEPMPRERFVSEHLKPCVMSDDDASWKRVLDRTTVHRAIATTYRLLSAQNVLEEVIVDTLKNE